MSTTTRRMLAVLSLVVAQCFGALLCFCMTPALGQDAKSSPARWPQFRGPGGLGIAAEGMKLPAEFGPDKNVLWKTALPHGHSSPCVWDDRIYVTGCDKDAKTPETQKLETLCIDRASGKILWRMAAPATTLEKVHELNNLASSSTATDGERVYSYFGSYGLLCYDRDGNELWKKKLSPIPGGFGSGTSPIVAGDLVLLNTGTMFSLSLLAVNGQTGEKVWQKDRSRGRSTGLWSSPVARACDGGHEVIVVGGASMVAYNLADGSERWQVNGLPAISLNTPAIGDGLAYFSLTNPIGDGDNVFKLGAFADALKVYDKDTDGKIAVTEIPENLTTFGRGRDDKAGDWSPLRSFVRSFDRDRDGQLVADEWQKAADSLAKTAEGVQTQIGVVAVRLDGKGDVSSTNVAWKQTKSVPEVPSPLCYHGRVYLVSEKGILTCRESATGRELYRQRLETRGTCYASPVACDGKVIVASDGGTVIVFKAGDEFQELANIPFGEAILATPALVDNKIYLRTEGHLYAFGE